MKVNTTKRQPQYNKKFAHYSHSPFSVSDKNVTVEVDKTGKTRLVAEEENDEYTEIFCSAGLIINLSRVLKSIEGKNIKLEVTGDSVKIVQDHEDETFDEVILTSELVAKASRVIFTTREVIMKEEPFDGEHDAIE
jgi:hypothetical protein